MGNQKSLLADITPLSDEDIARYAQRHRFSNDEVVTLHKYFTVIAGSLEDDGVIDMDEFQAALGFANSKFAERIFVALDEDKSERLEFSEFVNGFYLLSPMASNDEKVRFTFKIYDVDGNGSIDQAELYTLLRDVIRSDTTVNIMFRWLWFFFPVVGVWLTRAPATTTCATGWPKRFAKCALPARTRLSWASTRGWSSTIRWCCRR